MGAFQASILETFNKLSLSKPPFDSVVDQITESGPKHCKSHASEPRPQIYQGPRESMKVKFVGPRLPPHHVQGHVLDHPQRVSQDNESEHSYQKWF